MRQCPDQAGKNVPIRKADEHDDTVWQVHPGTLALALRSHAESFRFRHSLDQAGIHG